MTTTAMHIPKPIQASVPKTQALIGALLLTASALGGSARADVPLPAPTIPVNLPVPTSANVPFFSTVSAAFSPGGVLYVWDGVNVLQQQNGLSSNSYQAIGSAPGSNSADPGPIAFSNDGSQIWLGNGAGGNLGGNYNGMIFNVPAAGGTTSAPVGTVPWHDSFLSNPAASNQMFVDYGVLAPGSFFPDTSAVSIFNETTGASTTVIQGIPGASTSMAINNGRLYVGVGYLPDEGQIRSFPLTDLSNALSSGTPLDWSTSGAWFNQQDNNNGTGMFFDQRGYFFAGGDNGVTVIDPQGHSRVFDNGFSSIVYDAHDNDLLVIGNQTGIYSASSFLVPEPSGAALAVICALILVPFYARRRRRGASAAVPAGHPQA